jgi:hypothetical protein
MLVDDEKQKIWGHLAGPTPGASISIVVSVIETQLVEFSFKYTGSLITNENGLTQELCIMLNCMVIKERFPFWFIKEYIKEPEKRNSPQVDIGTISNQNEGIVIGPAFYCRRESFFSIEAKRLDNISKAREKEYLVGGREQGRYVECGGVERFKKEIHGKKLKYAAIIAYVQKYDFDYWHYKINKWIEALIDGSIDSTVKWSDEDRLVDEYKYSHTAKFKSENSRKKDTIFLFHLWVNLVKSTDTDL